MITLYLKAVSIIAPGITNWQQAIQLFTEETTYTSDKVDKKLTTMLPPNESRRCSRTIKLALSSIEQLSQSCEGSFDSQKTRYIFSSCNGDLTIFHQISMALAQQGRPVSPTKFHNSVHNAPAGYASIALKSQLPSTSITGYEDSFANALLEAAVQSSTTSQDCLLTAYDEIPPQQLLSLALTLIPIIDDFACSLLLSSEKSNKQAVDSEKDSVKGTEKGTEKILCRMDISITQGKKITVMEDKLLESLRTSNPQAKILPLLYSLARKEEKTLYFNDNQQQIAVKLSDFF